MELEKITESLKSKEKRGFQDACGTAHALELVGERWSLLIIRELMLGPRRFSELRADLPGISANVLTQRLAELEHKRLLAKRKLPPPASVQVYELTPWGYEAEPIIQVMGRWAVRSPAHDVAQPISGVSILLSFRTLLDLDRAKGIDARIGFRFGADAYVGHLTDRGFPIVRGDPADVDLLFEGDPSALAAIVHGGAAVEAMDGAIEVSGDKTLFERFKTLFPLPAKIDAI